MGNFRAYQREAEPRLPEFISAMQKKWDADRPRPEDLTTAAEAKKLNGEISSLKSEMERPTEEARAAEYLVMEGIYEHYWFGGNPDESENQDTEVYVTPTSEYDDVVNGIDMVVAIRHGQDAWMHLGIDVTTSKIDQQIEKKLKRTDIALKHDEMSMVEFYQSHDSPDSDYGTIEMPRIVLGIDRAAVETLAIEMMTNKSKMAGHPVQLEFIHEIIDQLAGSVEQVVNRALRRQAHFATKEFKTAEEAINFVDGKTSRKEIERLNPMAIPILDAHADLLEHFTQLLKEKSSIDDQAPERASKSPIFRLLAPRTSNEVLRSGS